MTTLNVLSTSGEALARTVELPAGVFDVEPNTALLHQVVVAQLAAARAGTAKTKTRGEVRGGGAKPYRQKGTGRARQGSTRAPQFVGGGVVHGPVPRDWSQRTPKKMKAAALRGALSDRARSGRVHVVAGVVDGEVPSTRAAASVIASITPRRRPLVVVRRTDTVAWRSLRNIAGVHLLDPGQLNTYDVLVSDDVVFTEDALMQFLSGARRGAAGASAGPGTSPDLRPHRLPDADVPSETVGGGRQEATSGPAQEQPAAREEEEEVLVSTSPDEQPGDTAPATAVGETVAAGDGVSDEEMVREVEDSTSSDLQAEPVFEAQHEGARTDVEMARAGDEEIGEEVDPR